MGIQDGDLGSHSSHKGTCSYASSGSTVSPAIVSVCLQAMWSMGTVKECYLCYEKSGDQYLGLVVIGLNCNSYLFAASPPYFGFTGVENKSKIEQNLDSLVKEYIPRGHHLKSRIFCIFRYCFASLCYHFDFLRQKLINEISCTVLFSLLEFPGKFKIWLKLDSCGMQQRTHQLLRVS